MNLVCRLLLEKIFFLMIRRPPRSTPTKSSAASDVYKRQALAPKPSLLLLDEPFSSLDPELREQLATQVRAILKKEQVTAVLVTHDQTEAFAVADWVGVMQAGEIVQFDTPYNIYHQPVSLSLIHI